MDIGSICEKKIKRSKFQLILVGMGVRTYQKS